MSTRVVQRTRRIGSFVTSLFVGLVLPTATAAPAEDNTAVPNQAAELTGQRIDPDDEGVAVGTAGPQQVVASEPALVGRPIQQAAPVSGPAILLPQGSASWATMRKAPDPQAVGVAETTPQAFRLSPPVMGQPTMSQDALRKAPDPQPVLVEPVVPQEKQ